MSLTSDHHDDPHDEDVWDGHIATRDDDIDLSEAFWGGSREWSDERPGPRTPRRRDATGALPRPQRRGERTGPVARTRTHRVVTPPHEEHVVDVPLDRDAVAGDQVRRAGGLAARLGLGRVDRRTVRIGVLVAIVVLLVPLALSLRPSTPRPTVTTGSPAAGGQAGVASVMPLAAAVAAGAVPAAAAAPAEADAPAAADVAQPEATPTVIDPSTLPRAPIINPDAGTQSRPSESSPTGGEATEASPAGAAVGDAAESDVPAARITRPCPMRYTVGQGDYWLRLADGADVPLTELLRLNGATVDTPLYPGAEICLPQHASGPTPTTSPAAAPVSPPYVWVDGDRAQAVIREVWPDDLEEQALRVAQRESNFVVTARNYCCYGLFQIYWSVHRGWLDELGITSSEQLYDARLNATAALHLYMRSGGWGPWT